MIAPFPHFSPRLEEQVNQQRIKIHKSTSIKRAGPIVYWMGRDRRLHDNWALRHAQELALRLERPLHVIAILQVPFLGAIRRQYDFSLEGFRDVETEARKRNISFLLQIGDPADILVPYLERIDASSLVMDMTVLKSSREKRQRIIHSLDISVDEVDAHNIIPVWAASEKKEYAAYTFRPKIHRRISEFLTQFPTELSGVGAYGGNATEWDSIETAVSSLPEYPLFQKTYSGTQKAQEEVFSHFMSNQFARYDELRNDPTKKGQSGLSPYLHFGFLSAQRLALQALKERATNDSRNAFLEELVVRRELADNFCYYESAYDTVEGFPAWAQKTLNEHRDDAREHLYTFEEFRDAHTHDALWNAAQREMLITGKMHGYMRMYWAKKILEWTRTPEEAMRVAISLNDTYELDGRDPNGYSGIAWSIGGVHDRAWFSRNIYGLIRYMSASGAKTKFDTKAYIACWNADDSLFV